MLHGAFDLSREDLIDRISPVREICSQRILRQDCYSGSSSQLFGSRMPRRNDSEKENSIRLLQELLGLEAGVKRMSARKIDIAGGAAFDDPRAEQLGQLHELFHDYSAAACLFGNNDRVFRFSEQ